MPLSQAWSAKYVSAMVRKRWFVFRTERVGTYLTLLRKLDNADVSLPCLVESIGLCHVDRTEADAGGLYLAAPGRGPLGSSPSHSEGEEDQGYHEQTRHDRLTPRFWQGNVCGSARRGYLPLCSAWEKIRPMIRRMRRDGGHQALRPSSLQAEKLRLLYVAARRWWCVAGDCRLQMIAGCRWL